MIESALKPIVESPMIVMTDSMLVPEVPAPKPFRSNALWLSHRPL